MREFVYECKDPLTGSAKIELPKYTQRLKYIAECNFEVNKEGSVEINAGAVNSIVKMIEVAAPHVKEVKIEHKGNGVKAECYEDLEYYPEFETAINEIAGLVLSGGNVGNA